MTSGRRRQPQKTHYWQIHTLQTNKLQNTYTEILPSLTLAVLVTTIDALRDFETG